MSGFRLPSVPASIIPDGGEFVLPINVLTALSFLVANVFLQRRAILVDVLDITEARIYRLLRLLPFVAAVDTVWCLFELVEVWWARRKRVLNPEMSEVRGLQDKSRADKSTLDDISNNRWGSGRLSKPSGRTILAIVAAAELVKLTAYRGIPFGAFCGWTLFMSYALNELLARQLPKATDLEDARMPASVKTLQKREDSLQGYRRHLQAWVVLALVFEFMHMAWLGHYFVPHTLWMDWGPQQIAETDHSNLTFPIPPGMPPAVFLPDGDAESLVVGFWPSHTTSGKIFYTLNYVVFASLASLAGTVLYCGPLMLACCIWWSILGAGLCLTGICIYHVTKDTPVARLPARANTKIMTIIGYIDNLPRWPRYCLYMIIGPPCIVCFYVMVLLIFTILLGPMGYLINNFDSELQACLKFLKTYEFIFIFVDSYKGSYATMAGLIIGFSLLVFRRLGIPIIARITRTWVTSTDKSYWTTVFTIVMMSVLSSSYYLLHFDHEGTKKPSWTWLIL